VSTATLTSKGQITLPKRLREILNLNPGDRIDFVLGADGRFDVLPIKSSLEQLKGCVISPKSISVEAMSRAVRVRAARAFK
jgi:antitoxin PrlF